MSDEKSDNELLDKVRQYIDLGGDRLLFHAELCSRKFKRNFPDAFKKIGEIQRCLIYEQEQRERLRYQIYLDIVKEVFK